MSWFCFSQAASSSAAAPNPPSPLVSGAPVAHVMIGDARVPMPPACRGDSSCMTRGWADNIAIGAVFGDVLVRGTHDVDIVAHELKWRALFDMKPCDYDRMRLHLGLAHFRMFNGNAAGARVALLNAYRILYKNQPGWAPDVFASSLRSADIVKTMIDLSPIVAVEAVAVDEKRA